MNVMNMLNKKYMEILDVMKEKDPVIRWVPIEMVPYPALTIVMTNSVPEAHRSSEALKQCTLRGPGQPAGSYPC